MATIVQRTAEGLSLEHPLAGAGSRFTAALLDVLVISVLYLAGSLFLIALLAIDVTGISGVLVGILFGGIPLCIALYHLVFHIAWRGQTPGKRVLGLRVVSVDGNSASSAQHLLRSTLWPLDAFLPPLPFGVIGISLIACTPRNQRLGDIVAGTLVVREQHEEQVSDPYPSKRWAQLEHRFLVDRPGLAARLDRADFEFLRRLLARADLRTDERRELFVRVAEHYRERLDLPPFGDARPFLGELYLYLRDAREARAA